MVNAETELHSDDSCEEDGQGHRPIGWEGLGLRRTGTWSVDMVIGLYPMGWVTSDQVPLSQRVWINWNSTK